MGLFQFGVKTRLHWSTVALANLSHSNLGYICLHIHTGVTYFRFNLLATDFFFFQILAHRVFKM